MRDLSPHSIADPPHISPAINTHQARTLGFNKEAIELLQVLPHATDRTAWGAGGEQEFVLHGTFADSRDDGALDRLHDPLYASSESSGREDENGPDMRPWDIVINRPGNHGTIMVLDLKTRQLRMEDQEGGGTSDPGLWVLGEHRQASENRNALENVPSPRVDVVLRDLMPRFVTLEWVSKRKPYGPVLPQVLRPRSGPGAA